MGKSFKLISSFKPSGDQPEAIRQLTENLKKDIKDQVLLGVTGSGKTFTMACVIEKINRPTLVLAPNKTLAAQLYAEFKNLFPENRVEYFVSYYDYYQPEAYVASRDLYIEKESSINEQIDRMRHAATFALLEREDVIIVSSVSCIYGLGSPEAYEKMVFSFVSGQEMIRDQFLRELAKIYYKRDDDLERGTFRVRGDVVDVFPPYEEARFLRVEFFGNYVDKISYNDVLTNGSLEVLDKASIYPASHYVTPEEKIKEAIKSIREELRERISFFNEQVRFVESERIQKRTLNDVDMISEIGFCSGIENYSRHLTGKKPGEPPPTLLDYFPKDFLVFVDESHMGVPQLGGMYRGDRSRKTSLVEHGFRLPSALDNRPLSFEEVKKIFDRVVYVSATPGPYELEKSKGLVTEQIIRPTGLLDPVITKQKAVNQVEDLLQRIKKRIKKNQRTLVTTLTKKSSEELTEYYESLGLKVKYLHSDIDSVERTEIIKDLREGVFDVLIGINLLREGLDLPEVSLVAILDADKEGFLRSERSLIQTMGRAARHEEGEVIIYADEETESIKKAIRETERRRKIQDDFNKKHKITPKSVKKKIYGNLLEIFADIPKSEKKKEIQIHESWEKDFKSLRKKIGELKKEKKKAVRSLDFEKAAKARDEIKRLQFLELQLLEGGADRKK